MFHLNYIIFLFLVTLLKEEYQKQENPVFDLRLRNVDFINLDFNGK